MPPERRKRLTIEPVWSLCMSLPFRALRAGGWGLSPGGRSLVRWVLAQVWVHLIDLDRVRYWLLAMGRRKF